MRFWLFYIYASFVTPLIIAVRKILQLPERLRARFFARVLWVGPRFKPDTKREKFYDNIGDAVRAARAGDTINIRGSGREL